SSPSSPVTRVPVCIPPPLPPPPPSPGSTTAQPPPANWAPPPLALLCVALPPAPPPVSPPTRATPPHPPPPPRPPLPRPRPPPSLCSAYSSSVVNAPGYRSRTFLAASSASPLALVPPADPATPALSTTPPSFSTCLFLNGWPALRSM